MLGLFALGVALQPVLASLGELHELAHDPTGGHAHVEHVDGASALDAIDQQESEQAGTLHVLLHFAHCCGQSATLLPALQMGQVIAAATSLWVSTSRLPVPARSLAPYRPPLS